MPELSVSIAMATCNGARFLDAQLQSFLDQQRLPSEVVVTDDGSTDATESVVRAFAARAPFAVRFSTNPTRLGYNRNFETAIQQCSGDVILISDQDDVWLRQHVQRIVEIFEQQPQVGFVSSNSTYVDETLQSTHCNIWKGERYSKAEARLLDQPFQFEQFVRHRALAGHASGFRTSLKDVVLPFFDFWFYDQWIALTCAAVSRVVLLDEPLTLHRHHAGQSLGHEFRPLSEVRAMTPTLGQSHFTQEVQNWSALLERATQNRARLIDPRVLDVLNSRVEFLKMRQALRDRSVLGRLSLIAVKTVQGHYHRHGRGWLTVARDVAG